ncbi:MAG: YihY/virulence factor BrkB family protein [Deltaproteobacteria bacterium]|nr:YihY/virulence factor BrkB family protein [Deltaproteobacteria bacterium]MBP7288500.1 YihY/virulence factor BrkB family protein [Nannocystaceae bacterium]
MTPVTTPSATEASAPPATSLPRRLASFTVRVMREFRRNRGFLLAGALGYNTLLSIVPLFALVVVVLSTIVDPAVLVEAIALQADTLLPGRGDAITEVFEAFVARRTTIGAVGFVALVLFAAMGFRMLDEAFSVVFERSPRPRTLHRLRAFVLPLAYVLLISTGILALTLLMVAFDALPPTGIRAFGLAIDSDTAVPLVKALALLGLVLLLSSFYWFMPQVHIKPRRAIVGGVVAALLWEIVRSIMMWYFATLSLVHVVYGSLATVVVSLLGLEVAAIILLLGAQIIAELERAAAHGRRWYEAAPPTTAAAPATDGVATQ